MATVNTQGLPDYTLPPELLGGTVPSYFGPGMNLNELPAVGGFFQQQQPNNSNQPPGSIYVFPPTTVNNGAPPPLGGGQNGINIFPAPNIIAQYTGGIPPPGGTAPGTAGATPPAGTTTNPSQFLPTATAPPPLNFTSPLSNFLASLQPYIQNLSSMTTPGDNSWYADILKSGGDDSYLRSIVEAGGKPFDATSTWQAMVEAQKQHIDRGAADIAERFNVMGGRFSNTFGNALGDYFGQATKDQNSLLGQLQMAAYEAAKGREFSGASQLSGQDIATKLNLLGLRGNAAQQLANFGFQGASQLSNQDFQNYMQNLMNSFNASVMASGQSANAAQNLWQGGVAGAGALFNASNAAANQLSQNEIQAATQIWNSQQSNIQAGIASSLQAQGMNINAANALAQQIMGQTQMGMNAGMSQYQIMQEQINRMYQEWLRTQPQYNPLLPYLFQLGSAGNPYYQPGSTPSALPGILGGAGSIAAALPAILRLFGIGG